MSYKIEQYKNLNRFNEQYKDIYKFLSEASDTGYNEHFHWGRFEWMMCHTMLETNELEKVALFKDENGVLVGLITYDTFLDDSVYLIHSVDDVELLKSMVAFAEENYRIDEKILIKANCNDFMLNEFLSKNGYVEKNIDNTVLSIDLDRNLNYCIPTDLSVSQNDFVMDNWKYQNVIHKGFDNEGIPEPWPDEFFKPTPNSNNSLKVFVMNETEYVAHCGVWYAEGKTAYVEPVVTISEFRKKGLAKAVVYEALNRAKKLGAKRAVVLSSQDFYFKIGFEKSSEVYCFEKTNN